MLQKAIDILRKRWPEVALIVILQAAMMLVLEEVIMITEKAGSQGPAMPFGVSFVLGLGVMLCAVLWQMLYLGFLKTAAVSGTQPQQPMQLLRSGRPYFLRILLFQILLGFALMFINMLIVTGLAGLVFQDRPLEQIPEWFTQMCVLIGILIVLKPMLLVPARIIVYDNPIFTAIAYTRFYQLSRIDNIFRFTFAGFAVILLTVLPIELFTQQSVGYYLLSGLHHSAFSLVMLALTLITVLWIQEKLEAEYAQAKEDHE